MSWPKKIQVDKRIVPLLSKSTYENFPRALRELISNAYDADATKVTIDIDVKKRTITVEDNGNGMTIEQFDSFLRIAGKQSSKRTSPKFKRKRIGQFGVGFLATFPFAGRVEITSTAENSDVIIQALIPAEDFMQQEKADVNVEEVDVLGKDVKDTRQRERHYTKVKLIDTSELVKAYFDYKSDNFSRKSIQSWEGIEKLRWELEEILPLQYSPSSLFREILKYPEPIGMDVWLNGKQLFRHDPLGSMLETHRGEFEQIGDLKFKYVITTNEGPINPTEAKGLIQRVNNVGVGKRTYFDLNVLGKTYRNILWLSGEIHILDGLDEAIALSRDQITWNPDYDELVDFFRKKLGQHAEKIDSVRTAVKEIESAMEDKITSPVSSKGKILSKNVQLLEKKGFTVKFKSRATVGDEKPWKINSKENQVVIYNIDSKIEDVINIAGKKRRIVYLEWDYENDSHPACRFSKNQKTIEINTKYPLFKSKRYGEVIKRFHILLLLASVNTAKSAEMYNYLIKHFLEEFEELL